MYYTINADKLSVYLSHITQKIIIKQQDFDLNPYYICVSPESIDELISALDMYKKVFYLQKEKEMNGKRRRSKRNLKTNILQGKKDLNQNLNEVTKK